MMETIFCVKFGQKLLDYNFTKI